MNTAKLPPARHPGTTPSSSPLKNTRATASALGSPVKPRCSGVAEAVPQLIQRTASPEPAPSASPAGFTGMIMQSAPRPPAVPLDYGQLYRDYAQRMHLVARRFFRCEQECADAVQDAFVAAIESGHRFHGRSQAWTWLYRILINVCLMRLRRRMRRATISLSAFADAAQQGDTRAASRFLADDSHVAHFEQRETLAHIRRILDSLPAGHRLIIQLRDLEERDTRETSAVLGISRSAVKTGLHRARRVLRAELARRRLAEA